MEAALGLAQLEDWEAMIAARRTNAKSLIRKLAHLDAYLQLPRTRPGNEHSFMMFPLVLRDEPKTELVNFLEQNGVETRDMLPLTNQPVYHRLLGWAEDDYPVAQWINQNGFYVGCHQDLTEFDLDYMAELFERFFRHRPLETRSGACLIITSSAQPAIEHALEAIPTDLFDRIVVINDGSMPDLPSLISSLPNSKYPKSTKSKIEIIPLSGPDALAMIVRGELEIEQDHLVFFAADGRHNPRDVGRLLLALERGHDMAIASRFIVGGERRRPDQMSRYRSIGNRVFSLLANLLFYGNLSDCLSQFRAVKRSRLLALNLSGQGLPLYYRLSIRAMAHAWQVAEIPTTEFIKLNLNSYQQIILSLIPVFWVLISEWLWHEKRER